MKKSDNSTPEEQEIRQFFDELKLEESQNRAPDLEAMLAEIPEKQGSRTFWRYVAAAVLLILGVGWYQWNLTGVEPTEHMTEIIISYEMPTIKEAQDENNLQLPGLDQWQSETDILLTGL